MGDTPQIDCAQGIPLLEGEDAGHHHEGGILPAGHEHEADAHIWMDPLRACSMLENLAGGLSQLDPDHAALYATNARLAREQLTQAYDLMKTSLESLSCRELITFHDGFSYFADGYLFCEAAACRKSNDGPHQIDIPFFAVFCRIYHRNTMNARS